jgi:hypothetical protein
MMMRLVMTALWISVAVGPIANDFNATHLFNPDWPPHARLHMMTVFTSAIALCLFGLYLCWGPAKSRLENLRLSGVLGSLYLFSLIAAAVTMPLYGASLYWTDTEPRAAKISDPNLIVFLSVEIIFLVLTAILFRQSAGNANAIK